MLSTKHAKKWLRSLCGGSDWGGGEGPGWHPGEHICGVSTEIYVPLLLKQKGQEKKKWKERVANCISSKNLCGCRSVQEGGRSYGILMWDEINMTHQFCSKLLYFPYNCCEKCLFLFFLLNLSFDRVHGSMRVGITEVRMEMSLLHQKTVIYIYMHTHFLSLSHTHTASI